MPEASALLSSRKETASLAWEIVVVPSGILTPQERSRRDRVAWFGRGRLRRVDRSIAGRRPGDRVDAAVIRTLRSTGSADCLGACARAPVAAQVVKLRSVSGAELSLVISVFLASAVEAVEAFTIVLAIGSTRDWRSALLGVGVATAILAILVLALGPALTSLPIGVLRLVVGGLLLVFGLQWLRKAILRAGGVLATHDEIAAFERETQAAEGVVAAHGDFDGYSFSVALKAVLLEGLEVAFIVLTFGANQNRVGLAAVAGAVAVIAVLAVGAAAHAPLSRVPENAMKFAVGILLTSFGAFWGAEGAGATWPGGDAALPAVVLVVAACSLLLVAELRRARVGVCGSPS